MNYQAYEFAHTAIAPLRWGAKSLKFQIESPFNPFRNTPAGRNLRAGCEVFENITRRYRKPEFAIRETSVHGRTVAVREEVVVAKPFCRLVHFARDEAVIGERCDPKVLLIAPMSGHYATLLRGTVEAMLPEHDGLDFCASCWTITDLEKLEKTATMMP